MTESFITGPADSASWEERVVEIGPARFFTLKALPDAANAGAADIHSPLIFHYLPAAPLLAVNVAGDPIFSLTLLLSRPPEAEEENVQDLIEQGVLSTDLTLALPPEVQDALVCEAQVEYRPLFARRASFALVWEEEETAQTLTAVTASGPDTRVALNATLDRPATLAVLAALESTPGPLTLKSVVLFRTAAAKQTVRLTGSWAAIYDFLIERTAASSAISYDDLRRAFADMLADVVVAAYRVTDAGREELWVNPDPAPLFAMFLRLSSILLQREGGEHYILRERPHPMFRLNYQERIAGDGQRSITLSAPLDQLIGGALAGRDWDRFVRLVAPSSNGDGVGPISRRTPWVRRGERWNDNPTDDSAARRFAAIGEQVQSVTLAALPASGSTLTLIPSSRDSLINPQGSGGLAINAGIIGGVELELPTTRQRGLPVVDDPSAPLWHDRVESNTYWYAPEFEVVQPAPNADPGASPFLFTYERTGVTGAGEPALAATIRFSLRKRMSDATVKRVGELGGAVPRSELASTGVWAGFPQFVRVPTERLAVTLLVPFVDEKDGRVKFNPCAADTIEDHGATVTVTVSLLNDWVRLCYGALAEAGFQTLPTRLRIDYTFASYVPITRDKITLAYGGKALGTSVIYAPADQRRITDGSFFDATTLTYYQPGLELHFEREPRQEHVERRPPIDKPIIPIIDLPNRPTRPVVVKPRPRPEKPTPTTPDLGEELGKVKYGTKQQLRQQQVDLLFPCNRLGSFYREKSNGHSTAIGCRNALQLGQIAYRQYEEIAELRSVEYRVYRSLSQPDQFLVAPTQYCISRRFAGAEADPYRPTIVLYATLDPENASNSRINLDVTLQPDLPPYRRRALLSQLTAYSPHPHIRFPTEVPTEEVQDAWLVDSRVDVQMQPVGPFLLALLETDLPGWLVLLNRLEHAGVTGSIRFTLPDETHLQCTLLLRLNAIGGPWDAGPIAVERTNGTVRLTNCIEQRVDVQDLALYGGTEAINRIPVERSLAAGATYQVAISSELAEIYPVYTVAPVGPTAITEIRSFVENIFQNVVFVNLINLANHNLTRLEITARIEGVEGTYKAQLSEAMPTAEIELILPLTTYLEQHTLQYRVTKIFSAGQPSTTAWINVDLSESAIISLTWESVQ